MIKKRNTPFEKNDSNAQDNDMQQIMELLNEENAPPEVKEIVKKWEKTGNYNEIIDFLTSQMGSFGDDEFDELDELNEFDEYDELDESQFNKEDIFDAMLDFTSSNKTNIEFTIAEMVTHCQKLDFDYPIDDMIDIMTKEMNNTDDFLRRYDAQKKCDVYIHKDDLFQDKKFSIRLTDYEIENDILIIGHRFLPFCYYNEKDFESDVLEKRSSLYDNNKLIKKKKHKINVSDVLFYFSLFGPIGVIEYLTKIDDSIDYISVLNEEIDFPITLPVFNMKKFYKNNNITNGDNLIVTVLDYYDRKFSIEPFTKAEQRKHIGSITKWINIFEKSLLKNIENNPLTLNTNTTKQLSQTFFDESEFLFSHPYVAIGSFLDQSKKVVLSEVHGYGILWKKNDNPNDSLDIVNSLPSYEEYIEDGEMMGALEGLLRKMNFDFTHETVVAYMKDEMSSNKKPELENVVEKCFDDRIQYRYSYLEDEFFNELELLWKNTSENYNHFEDKPKVSFRRKLLKAKDQHIKWTRMLDEKHTQPDDLNPTDIVMVGDFTSAIDLHLEILNSDDNSNKEIKKLESNFNGMLEDFPLVLDEVYENIKQNKE